MPSQLSRRVEALVGNTPKDQVQWLYDALTILDEKANGMLQINSLVMAVIAIFFSYAGSLPPAQSGTYAVRLGMAGCIIAFVLLALSSWRCLQIVRVGWGFLTDLTPGRDVTDFTREIEELCGVADRRTQSFWWAWWLSLLGFSLTAILAIIGGLLLLFWRPS